METITNKLYVVATPIGNLNEFTPRAIHILKSVDFIACEDTRNTHKLTSHFEIDTPLLSCHEHNEFIESDKLVNLIKDGKCVAYCSDAGYPGVSDPGGILIQKCIENDIDIEVISGPCAAINGLVGSGLDSTHFYFHGFLSHKKSDKKKELEALKAKKETLIFYEAPHRIDETLELLVKVLGNRKACVCRELTKKFEEFIRGTLEELLNRCIKDPFIGEMVIVVEGNSDEEVDRLSNQDLIKEVNKLVELGMSSKDAIKRVSELYNVNKNELYRLFHQS